MENHEGLFINYYCELMRCAEDAGNIVTLMGKKGNEEVATKEQQ